MSEAMESPATIVNLRFPIPTYDLRLGVNAMLHALCSLLSFGTRIMDTRHGIRGGKHASNCLT